MFGFGSKWSFCYSLHYFQYSPKSKCPPGDWSRSWVHEVIKMWRQLWWVSLKLLWRLATGRGNIDEDRGRENIMTVPYEISQSITGYGYKSKRMDTILFVSDYTEKCLAFWKTWFWLVNCTIWQSFVDFKTISNHFSG